MSPRRRSKRRSQRSRQPTQPLEFWKAVPELGPVEPIRPAADPGAVLRSLGNPPLTGQGPASGEYLEAVAKRAAQLMTGLANNAGLLAQSEED